MRINHAAEASTHLLSPRRLDEQIAILYEKYSAVSRRSVKEACIIQR